MFFFIIAQFIYLYRCACTLLEWCNHEDLCGITQLLLHIILLRDVFRFNYTEQRYKPMFYRCFYKVGIVYSTSQIYNSYGVILGLIFQTDNHW